MTSRTFIMLTIFAGPLTGCTDHFRVADFKPDPSALNDGEPVKVIYACERLEEGNVDFYNHIIVVSQSNGDTVNVFCPSPHGFTPADSNKTFSIVGENSEMFKLGQLPEDQAIKITHVDELKSVTIPKRKKIFRDAAFDHVAKNNYPFIVGALAQPGPPGTVDKVVNESVERVGTRMREHSDCSSAFQPSARAGTNFAEKGPLTRLSTKLTIFAILLK